jgi:hypothetical protein
VVSRLQCLRGISTQTGTGLAVEIGDWHRFTGATIGAHLRLVPQRILQLRQPQPGTDHQDRRRARLPDRGRGHRAPPPGLPPSERVDVRLVGDGLASNHVASPAIRIPMPDDDAAVCPTSRAATSRTSTRQWPRSARPLGGRRHGREVSRVRELVHPCTPRRSGCTSSRPDGPNASVPTGEATGATGQPIRRCFP